MAELGVRKFKKLNFKRFRFKNNNLVIFGVAFAVIGGITLLATHAASPAVSIEAESSTVTCPALTGTDSNASNNSYVQFGGCSAGTPTIPDTAYTIPAPTAPPCIPSNPIYADPVNGSDGNTGTQAAPVATLTVAYGKVAACGTIVLRAGVYHEGELSINKQVTIQPYPHEQAWLDGTTVQSSSGWAADSGTWRLDNSLSSILCKSGCVQYPQGSPIPPGSQIDPSYPMAGSPQMVFRDGNPLTEVGSKAEVSAGKFFFDSATNAMYLGDNPSGHTIEITSKRRAFIINLAGAGTTIHGIGIRRYGSVQNPSATGFFFAQAMSSDANGVTFEKNVFWQSASRGLYIGKSSGTTVRGNIFQANGMNGVDMTNETGLIFEQNQVLNNNAEHFSTADSGAGVIAGSKVVTSTGGTIQDNIFDGNGGPGWWCDLNCDGFKVVRNIFRNNTRKGLFYEVSNNGIIASNLVYNNTDGMAVGSANTKIFNNTVVNNGSGIIVYDDSRAGGTSTLGPDTANVQVINNIISSTGSSDRCSKTVLIDACQGPPNGQNNGALMFPYPNNSSTCIADATKCSMDYNLYLRPSAVPSKILSWSTSLSTSSNYDTVAAIRTALHFETNGIDSALVLTSMFTDVANADFHLKAGSPALNAGATLPSDVATAIGVAASPVNIGMLAWPK